MVGIWRDRINSLKDDLDFKIQCVLLKSFASLPLDSQRQLFLDIACFFVGESTDMVTVLRDDLHAESGIKTLINRCLLIKSDQLIMHKLHQEMGRKSVKSLKILQNGSNTIEGLALDMRKVRQGMGSKVLNSLKILNLKGCDKLASISNLYRLPKLQILILWNCSSLTHLCKTIGDLESLLVLDLKGCTKLLKCVDQPEKAIIPEQSLLSLPPSLVQLDLANCGLNFKNDVYLAFHAQSLINLCLGCNMFELLPSSIDLNFVMVLNLLNCSNLRHLPCIPSTLQELYIDCVYH
ncbi:disease resistance protein RPP2A-like [Bidens hawaiensis]|uniref:disease resistance protein RPP2A-like n=1 Tax=Bidens hawaiensis TaxID=980011 RepID=UPI0040494E62